MSQIASSQPISVTSSRSLLCQTLDTPLHANHRYQKRQKSSQPVVLRLFLEVDYASYLLHDSDSIRVDQWVRKFADSVVGRYQSEDIHIQLSDIYIWKSPDPYDGAVTVSDRLGIFSERHKMGFNGDLAHLITVDQIGGGLAYFNSLCTSYEPGGGGPFSIGASIYPDTDTTSLAEFWNQYILAHEIGHIMGSQHTHACVWGPSSDEPIDNCFSSEGGCPNSGLNEIPGSIMSYCHFSSRGIDLEYGLGAQPRLRIIDNISTSGCLSNFYTECIVNESCDDGNPCTMADRINAECQCIGNLIDINQNDICDMYEDCDQSLYVSSIDPGQPFGIARSNITLTAQAPNQLELNFSAGQSITLNQGFEIPIGSTFNTYLHGCKVTE